MNVKGKKSRFRRAVTFLLAAGLFGGLAATAVVSIFILTTPIPDTNALREREVLESTKIYDRTGETLLFEIYNEEKRTVIPFEEIPRHVKNATLAIEDANFYKHPGVSVFSIVRAFTTDILRGQFLVQGGSTITQQLVKNTLLTNERSITRKIKEAVIALKIERVHTKDEILNMYLNEIPYGSNAYGIEAAAQTFFGTPARDLTLAEAAYLAALPKAPTYFSPYGSRAKELEARKNIVIARMEELQFITPETADAAHEEQVEFLAPAAQGIRAPHFVMHVIDLLAQQFGDEFIQKNGLVVRTTLDMELQQHAEDVVAAHAESIEKNFNAGNTGLVATDPQTGEILAMVGSRDYFDNDREGNFNVTLARRQPGSAFKPLVYAAAFEKGYTPETIVFDVLTEFATGGTESYQPHNYDNTFKGPVTLREALAQSINVPAVKVLYLTGLREALDAARRLGITTLAGPNQYGLTLVLGGGEVRLLELVSAYGVFANNGVRNETTAIVRVERNNGDVLWSHEQAAEQVLDATIARMVSDILADNAARAPAFGSASALHFPGRSVAVKTGTTNDYRDAWIIGYTPSIAAGVWAGNNDNTPMEKRVAGFIVAPIWHDFMERALQGKPDEPFGTFEFPDTKKPFLNGEWRGGRTYTIDTVSKKRATDQTPAELIETKVIPEVHSILHWVHPDDPQGAIPERPEQNPQYTNWETPVRLWADQKGLFNQEQPVIPTEEDTVHIEANKPRIDIQKPAHNAVFSLENPLTVSVAIESAYPIAQTDYFFNGAYIGSNKTSFRQFVFTPMEPTSPEGAELTVKAYDEVGNTGEQSVVIRITE